MSRDMYILKGGGYNIYKYFNFTNRGRKSKKGRKGEGKNIKLDELYTPLFIY